MHDIKWIRENPEAFDRALMRRSLDFKGTAQRLIELDEHRRAAIQKAEAALARRNAASREIGAAKKSNEEETAQRLLAEVARLKQEIPDLESKQKEASQELWNALAELPNLPLPEVPDGKDETANVEHHHFGAKRNYGFDPKQHFDLGEGLSQMDFGLAAKLSGARFVVLKRSLARLERALGQFMLDLHTTEHGYTEVAPPLLVRDDVMFGTAQLPKFRDDQFATKTEEVLEPEEFEIKRIVDGKVVIAFRGERREELTRAFNADRSGLKVYLTGEKIGAMTELSAAIRPIVETTRWLIPTAEVPLTNLVRDSIIDEAQLPLRFTACTPCFRAEAGAAGKDTRGMIRQHQFTKVELVSITTPDKSKEEHERMLSCAEEVLRRLDLHYRVVTLCTGDMGFASQKTYDIEVWLPGQNMYREISSCSVCGDFQARRMDARFRPSTTSMPLKGNTRDVPLNHVHTLNGSGVAVGRALIAVLETYQQQGGSIAVPDALQGYMGGLKTIERA